VEIRRRRKGRTWTLRRIVTVGVAIFAVLVLGVSAAVAVLTKHRKVLVIGDSLTFQSESAIKSDLQARGFDVDVLAVGGTGLLDTKFDWVAQAQQLIAQDHPDIVVAEFIGNYGLNGARPGIADGSPQFYAAWATAAQQATDVLSSGHAQVYWVLGPPLADPGREANLVTLDNIYRNLEAPSSPAGRPLFVDALTPFSDSQGGYTSSVPGLDGQPVVLRTIDGTHLTPAGSQRLADAMTAAVVAGKS
jgi:uncharacterized protein